MKKVICTLIFSIAAVSVAQAYKEVGNGGTVVACPSANGIPSYELLDLYEGRALYNLSYNPQTTPAKDQAHVWLQKLDISENLAGTEASLAESLGTFIQQLHFLPSGTGLQPTNDIDTVVNAKGCQITQVINYRDTGEIYVDQDVWRALTEFNRAALIVHEMVYSYLRGGTDLEKSSLRARRVTAQLVAGSDFSMKIPATPAAIFTCRTFEAWEAGRPYADFQIYQAASGKLAIRFINLNGRKAVGETTIESSHSTAADWKIGWLDISGNLNSLIDSDTYIWLDARPGRQTRLRVRTPTETTNETVLCQ